VKLAFRRGRELSASKVALAIFPMTPTRYRTLQREDVFPEPFQRDEPHIGVIAGVIGLSWARPTVSHRIPLPSVGQRSFLLQSIPHAPQRVVVEDTKSIKGVEEGSYGM